MADTMDCEYPPKLMVIIDDDASVRRALHRLLKSLGHEVAAFGTVVEYLRSKTLAETAILILDVQMPGMSGLDLQDIIAALRAPIPIIFITAHPDEETRTRAMGLGTLGFLEKPFDEDSFISLLDKGLASLRRPSHSRTPSPT